MDAFLPPPVVFNLGDLRLTWRNALFIGRRCLWLQSSQETGAATFWGGSTLDHAKTAD
jgi:hypothetical protein